jgi:hypothetical protein
MHGINFYRVLVGLLQLISTTCVLMLIFDSMRSNIGVSHVFTIPGGLDNPRVLGWVSGPCDRREGGKEVRNLNHYFNILAPRTPHLSLLFDNRLDTQKVWVLDSVRQLASCQGWFRRTMCPGNQV